MHDIQGMGDDAALAPKKSTCYFCQQVCKPGDGLCNKCETRFQPQEEVFDYSDSEYEDDAALDDRPHSPPEGAQHPPATPPMSAKRRDTRYPRPRESPTGWSETSSVSYLQQSGSRSASTSPTPHVALELKVVPPQDIKIRTVSSPIRATAGDGPSAFHRIQQAMKSRGSVSPGDQDSDAIRLGKVRSGEIRRVDYPDIIKAKPATPNDNGQRNPLEQQYQSRGSFGNWLKYYAEDDKNNERTIPETPGTYDRVTSIYDIYASSEDT
ncbi:hypothetical protein Daus18300_000872 [Diaporthe australafricana]|uniref:Uncharacterized protein n=1 Tax=Diaporthe australafricana TaxID=127596 RepID=A0ABR3Y1D0_9PEZI